MIEKNVKLSAYSNYKIGGLAQIFFKAEKLEDLFPAVDFAKKKKTKVFILGGGTNVLFSDDKFDGVVINLGIKFIEKENDVIRVGAGVSITELSDFFIENSFSGLEWAGGLPGTLGGAVYGNAGAFKGEIKDLVEEVVSLNISEDKPKIIKRKKSECFFDYRSSIFKSNRGKEIIVEICLKTTGGDKSAIRALVEEKINYRNAKQPLEYPNIGSIFKNINFEFLEEEKKIMFKNVVKTDPFPVVPVAHLISEAGLKGVSFGGAMISPKHPNFIVNVSNAASNDVKNLIKLAKNEVRTKFNIDLEEEIIIF